MIEANEAYVIEALEDIGIEKNKIIKVIEHFEGWRIYFRKKPTEYNRIQSVYRSMVEGGMNRPEAIKRVSELFEKSVSAVRIITREQRGLL